MLHFFSKQVIHSIQSDAQMLNYETITGGARLTQIQSSHHFQLKFFSITQTKYFKSFDLQPIQTLIKDSL